MPSKSLNLMLAAAASAGILAGCGRHRQQTAQGDPFLHSSPNHSLAATAEKAHADLQRNVRQSANKVERHLDEIPKPHQTINRAALESEDPFLVADENPFRPSGAKSTTARSTAKPAEPLEHALPGGVAPAIDVADNARSEDFDASPFAPEPKTSSIKQTSATTEAAFPAETAEMTENPFDTSAPPPKKPAPSTASVVETKKVVAPDSEFEESAPTVSDGSDFEWANEPEPKRRSTRTVQTAETSEPIPSTPSNPFEEDLTTTAKPVGWATSPEKPQPAVPRATVPMAAEDANPFAEFNKRNFHETAEDSQAPKSALPSQATPIPTEGEANPQFDAGEDSADALGKPAEEEPAGRFEFRSSPISQMSYTVEEKRPAPKKPARSTTAAGWKARKPNEHPLPSTTER